MPSGVPPPPTSIFRYYYVPARPLLCKGWTENGLDFNLQNVATRIKKLKIKYILYICTIFTNMEVNSSTYVIMFSCHSIQKIYDDNWGLDIFLLHWYGFKNIIFWSSEVLGNMRNVQFLKDCRIKYWSKTYKKRIISKIYLLVYYLCIFKMALYHKNYLWRDNDQ